MKQENIKTYVRFTFAPYALAHILLALDSCGIVEPSITLVDNNLMVSIDKEKLLEVVYKLKENGNCDACISTPKGF